METRASVDKLWIIDKVPSLWSVASSKPATYEDVYRHFRFLLSQEYKTVGKPQLKNHAKSTAFLLRDWWQRAVPEQNIISINGIIKKIENLHNEYAGLYKLRKRDHEKAKKSREALKEKMSKTFIIVTKKGLLQEDLAFVENMESTRTATLGSVDMNYEKSKKRKASRKKARELRIEKELKRRNDVLVASEINITDSETESEENMTDAVRFAIYFLRMIALHCVLRIISVF